MHKRYDLVKKLKIALKQSSLPKSNDMFIEVCNVIIQQLKEGTSVRLPHIGMFYVETMAPCSKRDPRTGELLEIPERRRLRFKPAKGFNKLLNEE